MATSSLYKTFSLKTKEETNAFMQMFEESLRNPQKIEPSGVEMASDDDTKKLIEALRKQYADKLAK